VETNLESQTQLNGEEHLLQKSLTVVAGFPFIRKVDEKWVWLELTMKMEFSLGTIIGTNDGRGSLRFFYTMNWINVSWW